MRRRLLYGAGVALVYLVGAAISSHLSPSGTLPVFDGLAPPPPYRWVQPPATLAATNQKPFAGKFSLKFKAGKSAPGAFTTRDAQFSLILDPGTLPPSGNPTRATITITPLAASSVTQPSGYLVDGNIYRVTVTEEPSGAKVSRFAKPQQVIIVYPADRSFVKPKHLIAVSGNGKTWTQLQTQDSTVQQQSAALIPIPGFVAVVVPAKQTPSGRALAGYVIAGIVVLLVAGILGWRIYRRSQRARTPRR
ncbi:MAG: hypothetical protein M3P18_03030 [Actinomycetota bacterium]|nr:hypothetical protein [Actinomycetota bacterium]